MARRLGKFLAATLLWAIVTNIAGLEPIGWEYWLITCSAIVAVPLASQVWRS